MPSETRAPQWIRDAIQGALDDARLYLSTAFGFTFHPVRFTDAWARHERKATNPFGVLATGAGITGGAAHLVGFFTHHGGSGGDDSSLLVEVLDALAPFAYYALLGALCHGLFRLFGSKRRLADSLGVALFAGGGPAVGMLLLSYAIALVAWLAIGQPPITDNGLLGTIPRGPVKLLIALLLQSGFIAFLVCFALGMHGLHRVRAWTAPLAVFLALVLAAVGFGVLPDDLGFRPQVGTHPVIYLPVGAHHRWGLSLIID